jgi:hypothetical protein
LFQNYISNTDPEVLSRLNAQQGMSPDMIKTATDMIKTMKPEELQKMFQVASSLNQTGPLGANPAQNLRPNMPEMVKMASETISKMSPEDLQRMMSTTSSSLGANRGGSSSSSEGRNEGGPLPSVLPDSLTRRQGAIERGDSSASAPDADLQEAACSTMNDPAMRQVLYLFAILKFPLSLSLSLSLCGNLGSCCNLTSLLLSPSPLTLPPLFSCQKLTHPSSPLSLILPLNQDQPILS